MCLVVQGRRGKAEASLLRTMPLLRISQSVPQQLPDTRLPRSTSEPRPSVWFPLREYTLGGKADSPPAARRRCIFDLAAAVSSTPSGDRLKELQSSSLPESEGLLPLPLSPARSEPPLPLPLSPVRSDSSESPPQHSASAGSTPPRLVR